MIVGFPIALVASWLFEFAPDGIKRTVAAGDGALVKPQTTDLILAGALARLRVAAAKVQVTLRLDPAVIAHFKRAGGAGWQTRINDTLARAIARKR